MEGLFYLRPQSSVLIYVVLARREQKIPALSSGGEEEGALELLDG